MGQAEVTSVSTMAGYADSLTNTVAGATVVFSNGEDAFLFIQGGAAGVDDDYVSKIGGVASGVGLDLTIGGSAEQATVDFTLD